MKTKKHPSPPRTGWAAGMLQDDCRELSKWLSNKPGARRLARQAARSIKEMLREDLTT